MRVDYTICFCRHEELVLMLYRHRPPNRFRWNGIGGKLEHGESPRRGIDREVVEEAGIELVDAESVRFAGIVTWSRRDERPSSNSGMYAFVAELGDAFSPWAGDRVIAEGILAWKPITWAVDPDNNLVVGNIPRFLPLMLQGRTPVIYHCHYEENVLVSVESRPPPESMSLRVERWRPRDVEGS